MIEQQIIPIQARDRSTYIGSADAAGLFGLADAYNSPYSIFARKTGLAGAVEVTEAMQVGLVLEGYILQRYAREENTQIAAQQVFIQHPDYDFLGATLDGLVFAEGNPIRVVEAKTTRDYKWDEVPLRYEAQVQWQMGIAGIHEADLTVLHRPDLQLKTYRMAFNPAIYDALVDKAVQFWYDHIETGSPPPVDGNEATTEALKQIQASPGESVSIDNMAQRIAALNAIKLQIKELQGQKELIENELRAALGEAEIGFIDGKQAVTWKAQNSTQFDQKKFQAENQELYQKYISTTSSRVLRVSK